MCDREGNNNASLFKFDFVSAVAEFLVSYIYFSYLAKSTSENRADRGHLILISCTGALKLHEVNKDLSSYSVIISSLIIVCLFDDWELNISS